MADFAESIAWMLAAVVLASGAVTLLALVEIRRLELELAMVRRGNYRILRRFHALQALLETAWPRLGQFLCPI